jgi:hypothetical protein
LVRKWGGVSLAYRKRMQDSPAYRLNHEEVKKALEEGISFIENVNPEEAILDELNNVRAVRFSAPGRKLELSARSVLVAAGTSPNITYEKEHAGSFKLDGKKKFFESNRAVRNADGVLTLEPAGETGFFTSYSKDGDSSASTVITIPDTPQRRQRPWHRLGTDFLMSVSLFDEEIQFARYGFSQPERDRQWTGLARFLDSEWTARVSEVRRLTPTIVEVIVHAPAAARKFEPGQFYRLQNYETTASVVRGTRLLMEGIALTGASVDKEKGLLSMIALEMGVSLQTRQASEGRVNAL